MGLPDATTSSSKVTCRVQAADGFRAAGKAVRLHGRRGEGRRGGSPGAVPAPGGGGTPKDIPVLPHLERQEAEGRAEQCREDEDDERGLSQAGGDGEEGTMVQSPEGDGVGVCHCHCQEWEAQKPVESQGCPPAPGGWWGAARLPPAPMNPQMGLHGGEAKCIQPSLRAPYPVPRPLAPSGFGVLGVPSVYPAAALLPCVRAEPRWRRSPEMSRDGSKPHGKTTQIVVLLTLFVCLSFPCGAICLAAAAPSPLLSRDLKVTTEGGCHLPCCELQPGNPG